jgi:hypothetical protein
MGESSQSIHTTKKLKIIAWTPTSIQARAELASYRNEQDSFYKKKRR